MSWRLRFVRLAIFAALCAENGLHVAWSGLHGKWEMASGVTWELSAAAQRAPAENWNELALSVIEGYVERCGGSYVESTANSIAFVYTGADPEFGSMHAKELHNHLSEVLTDAAVVLNFHGLGE